MRKPYLFPSENIMAKSRLAVAWVALVLIPTLAHGQQVPVNFAVKSNAAATTVLTETVVTPVAWNPAPVADVRSLAPAPKPLPAVANAAEALKLGMNAGAAAKPIGLAQPIVTSTGASVDPNVNPVSFGVAAASDIEFSSASEFNGSFDSCVSGCDSCVSGSDSCTSGCDSCVSGCDTCCKRLGRTRFYADYLYIQPTDADFNYAIPRDGQAPMGRVGNADPDYQPGIRLGFDIALDRCSSIGASYTWFESQTHDSFAVSAPDNIGSLVLQPATTSASSTFLFAESYYDIDFQLIDVVYRALLGETDCGRIDYLVGVRYGNLQQDAQVNHSTSGFSPTVVTTDIEFDGVGIQVGLDGDRQICGGFRVYGRALANFLAGEFRSQYTQVNQFNVVEATSSLDDDRIVPVLEAEFGVMWASKCDCVRVSAGYYYSSWLNSLSTRPWINAVQDNDFDFNSVQDAITFSGLAARAEIRF